MPASNGRRSGSRPASARRCCCARQPSCRKASCASELLRGTDGQWVDLVVWRDAAAAAAVALTAASSPVCASYFALMEGVDHADPGVGVQYFERAARFGLPAA
jgi:hypothetical protein